MFAIGKADLRPSVAACDAVGGAAGKTLMVKVTEAIGDARGPRTAMTSMRLLLDGATVRVLLDMQPLSVVVSVKSSVPLPLVIVHEIATPSHGVREEALTIRVAALVLATTV
jgi:hypothetical protein